MSTKTPKQGSHASAGHQHVTCQRSVSHTRIFDIEFLYLFYSRFPGSHCKPKTSKQLTCPDHMFAKTTFESLTCPAHDLTKKEKKTPLKGYVKNRESISFTVDPLVFRGGCHLPHRLPLAAAEALDPTSGPGPRPKPICLSESYTSAW